MDRRDILRAVAALPLLQSTVVAVDSARLIAAVKKIGKVE